MRLRASSLCVERSHLFIQPILPFENSRNTLFLVDELAVRRNLPSAAREVIEKIQ